LLHKLAAHRDRLVGNGAALLERLGADRLEFLLAPADPMPQVKRPSDNTSIVEMTLAVSTGGRCGTTVTEVTRRSFEVLAATNATQVSCSWRSPPARPGNSPVSE
jgi:hypothetical protein